MTVLTAVAFAALAQPGAAPSISQYIQTGFKDVTFDWVKTSAKQSELQKINSDFAQSYRVKDVNVQMKEPFMIRLESKINDTDMLMIMNGATRKVSIPRARINTKEDLSKAPGKRQTTLDFGILSSSLFNGLFTATYIRKDRATGHEVFDLKYNAKFEDSSRHRVWIDPDQKFVAKREWYSQDGGKLMASFTYDQPKKVNGIWVPTRQTVRTSENTLAGISEYRNIKVNAGLSNSLFAVN